MPPLLLLLKVLLFLLLLFSGPVGKGLLLDTSIADFGRMRSLDSSLLDRTSTSSLRVDLDKVEAVAGG